MILVQDCRERLETFKKNHIQTTAAGNKGFLILFTDNKLGPK